MPEPRVSVVVATHDRAQRLRALLASLRVQTIGTQAFEVVVVDDGSSDGTPAVLEEARARGDLQLRVRRRPHAAGPATARDEGWRAARAPLVAFTDDDCVAQPDWLEAMLGAAGDGDARIVQGAVGPIPEEAHRLSPFSRTIVVDGVGPPFPTANMLYPRAVLEAVGGFDRSLPKPAGEDTDLAWRALQAGADVVFAPDARVHHAVLVVGPLGMLRHAWRWQASVPVYARHPGLRRRLHRGVFWSPVHEQLLLAVVAAALPRSWWPVRVALAAPYLRHLAWRRTGPLLAPFILAHDLVEVAAMVRGSVRERVLVL